MSEEDIQYIIMLNTGNKVSIVDAEGNRIFLSVGIGEVVYYEGMYYRGKLEVNLVGE